MKRKLSMVFLVSACAASAAEHGAPGWSHAAGANGPDAWGSVAPQFATCGTAVGGAHIDVGMRQSPIDIATSAVVRQDLPDLSFLYEDAPLEVENTGHVIEVPYARGSRLLVFIEPSLSGSNWLMATARNEEKGGQDERDFLHKLSAT